MVGVRILFIFQQLEYLFSSFTGASNARNDCMSVTSVTCSMCLVYKISNLKTSDTKAIAHGQSANSVHFQKVNISFSSFPGATNARNDGMSGISLIYSTCLVHNVSDPRTSDFSDTKVRVRILFIFYQLEYFFFFIHRSNQCKE